MTDFATLLAADKGQKAHTVHLVDKESFDGWQKQQSPHRRALLAAHKFDGKTGYQFAILPGEGTGEFDVVSAVANVQALSPWCMAKLGESLPEGTYRLADGDPGKAMLGWLLAQHKFDRYRPKKDDKAAGPRILVTGEPARIDATVRLAEATILVRDLVNTPAADLGPADLEAAARDLEAHGGKLKVTKGAELDEGYPLIAAVGAAAAKGREPRLIEVEWGENSHPRVAVVGKGVCFDSGGLDLKPASGMRWMKKDMGGAAHALALARLIIQSRLPVRLHLLIPAVENAVAGNALRPGDIVTSRKGLTVEIDNTDAEGRLVLADAIARAVEAEPSLIIDFATLTGAARVALGPELPALFANDDDLLESIESAAKAVEDPVWRMPLWDGYDEMLKSDIADLANSANSPMAGAVTAALFLRRFVPKDVPWAHLDTYAWQDQPKPGRPKGGAALGLRALFATLEARFAKS